MAPGLPSIAGALGPHAQVAGDVDADRGGPTGSVRGPINRGVGMHDITIDEWEKGLPPGGAAVRRMEHCLEGSANRIGTGDDPIGVEGINGDRRLAPWCRLRP